MRRPLLVLGVLGAMSALLLLADCRSNPGVQPNAAVQSNPTARPRTAAIVADLPNEPLSLTSAWGPESPTLKARMRDHETHAALMRDAVARAELDAARREAKILADLRIDGGIEPTWRKHLDAMNAAADRVAKAKELAEASRGLAAVARTCGDCHVMLGGPHHAVGEPPGEDGGVAQRMKRHQWAASALWDGLVVPSDEAWNAAARVLTDAPLEPVALTPGKTPTPVIGTLAASVHELGRKARVAKAAVDRGAIYGELVATCAACHQRLGGGPSGAKER